MTPEQKIKHAILLLAATWGNITLAEGTAITDENVDDIYQENDQEWELQDARNEIRASGTKTGLECQYSRHYESDAVAKQMPDGSWVGWTYWYGGGKHGEPEAVDWMDYAYELECVEEEKTVIVQTFTKKSA